MVKKSLVYKKGGKNIAKPIEIFNNTKALATVSSDLALKVIDIINKEPSYPIKIARDLKEDEQKIYYHIRRMYKMGLIEIVKEEMRHGAVCKYYAPISQAFGFELEGGEEIEKTVNTSPKIREFLHEFIRKGTFDGSIVVGSPLAHGPYNTEAKDGYLVTHLGMFIGSLCATEERFVIKTDTETKAEKSYDRNMILIGGPIINTVMADLNDKLKIKFKYDGGWHICHKDECFSDERDVLIGKIKNPWDATKSIVFIAGLKSDGTKTGIIALTQYYDKLLKSFDKNKDFYAIIRGLDKDGDGKIDNIRVLETI